MKYKAGNKLRLRAKFYDENGTLGDPTTVTFMHEEADGTKTTWVYGVDSEIVRISQGIYECSFAMGPGGEEHWAWIGDGNVVAREEGSVRVEFSYL